MFPLTPYPERFNFVEIAIIRSPVCMSFHRVAIASFECNVLSCGLGREKNNNINKAGTMELL